MGQIIHLTIRGTSPCEFIIPEVNDFPSNIGFHQISEEKPAEAYLEMLKEFDRDHSKKKHPFQYFEYLKNRDLNSLKAE